METLEDWRHLTSGDQGGDLGAMGLGILWKGITLGLGAAAPIGPVNVEIARRAIRGGFRAGFLLGLGAVTVDVSYVILASLSVRLFLDYPRVMLGMGVAGGAFLILLGIECLRGASKEWAKEKEGNSAADTAAAPGAVAEAQVRPRRNYLTGVMMTALNPMTLAF